MKICDLCRKSDTNDLEYGEWKQLGNINVHYWCLLLSTNTNQSGQDDEGILGFLKDDIEKSIQLAKDQPCFYCQRFYATIKCAHEACYKFFHLPCGRKNFCLNEFDGNFNSYCARHSLSFPEDPVDKQLLCVICLEFIKDTHPLMLVPPCYKTEQCQQSKFNCFRFHRKCVQEHALVSGSYQLRCNICLEHTDEYVTELRMRGIFVPETDAAWEQTNDPQQQDAFSELLYRPNKCDAPVCYCPHPDGRSHKIKRRDGKSDWNIKICKLCGACASHTFCMGEDAETFTCKDCKLTISKSTAANGAAVEQHDTNGEGVPTPSSGNGVGNNMPTTEPEPEMVQEDLLMIMTVDIADDDDCDMENDLNRCRSTTAVEDMDVEIIGEISSEDEDDEDALTLRQRVERQIRMAKICDDDSDTDVAIIDESNTLNGQETNSTKPNGEKKKSEDANYRNGIKANMDERDVWLQCNGYSKQIKGCSPENADSTEPNSLDADVSMSTTRNVIEIYDSSDSECEVYNIKMNRIVRRYKSKVTRKLGPDA